MSINNDTNYIKRHMCIDELLELIYRLKINEGKFIEDEINDLKTILTNYIKCSECHIEESHFSQGDVVDMFVNLFINRNIRNIELSDSDICFENMNEEIEAISQIINNKIKYNIEESMLVNETTQEDLKERIFKEDIWSVTDKNKLCQLVWEKYHHMIKNSARRALEIYKYVPLEVQDLENYILSCVTNCIHMIDLEKYNSEYGYIKQTCNRAAINLCKKWSTKNQSKINYRSNFHDYIDFYIGRDKELDIKIVIDDFKGLIESNKSVFSINEYKVLLLYLKHKTFKEIALELEISEQTSRRILEKSKEKINRLWINASI